LKWGPTAFNGQPGRYLFIHSDEARQKLLPALSSGNRDKTAAPLTVVLAWDPAFHQHLPQQFPAYDAKGFYDGLPQLVEPHARLNASLQAAYLILAARALGLDAGPMAGFDAAAVDAAFFPDGQWRSLLLVNLGYGVTEGLPPRGHGWNSNRRLPSSDRITHVKLLAAHVSAWAAFVVITGIYLNLRYKTAILLVC
jgi:3-hydroxypropanoate dehydrogenase